MAGDAEAHPVHLVHLVHLRHAGDVAVAGGAGVGAQHLDMPLVGEMRVTGQVMNPDPLDRLLVAPGLRTFWISVLLALSLPLTTR
jgi:hypothetical protein